MPASMTGQEGHSGAVQNPGQDLVRRRAEGGLDLGPFRLFEAVNLINARAADHADHLVHSPLHPQCLDQA